jgi:antitoxin HicB
MNKPISLVYAAKIEQEDNAFVVTFRDLPNIFTQGDTYEEALFNAQEALDILLLDMANDDLEFADPTPCEAGEIPVTVSPDVAAPVLLHKLRKLRHCTLTQVAKVMNVSYQSYQQIENGKNITLKSLKKAAAALGATVQITFNPID